MVAPSGEGAVRCMRMALVDRQGAGRLHQSARHLDADRRPQGDRGDPRGIRGAKARRSRRPNRSPATRYGADRRPGGDLFAADDEQRLHLRERQYRRPSIPAFADMPIVRERRDNVALRLRAVELVRLRRDQCVASAQAAGCLIGEAGGDVKQNEWLGFMKGLMTEARAGSWGSRTTTRSPGVSPRRWRRRARSSPSPIRARRSASGSSRSRQLGRRLAGASVRRREHRLARRRVRGDRQGMGLARLPRPRHRVLGQERAERPLCRHHAGELPAHHADLVLRLHRGGQARRRPDAGRRRDGDADLQWRRARHAQLQRDGCRQGGARGLGALSGGRLRAAQASASTRSRPARSARWPAPASTMRASCSRSSSSIRRSGAV